MRVLLCLETKIEALLRAEAGWGAWRSGGVGRAVGHVAVEGAHGPCHIRPQALALFILAADVSARDRAVVLPFFHFDPCQEQLFFVEDVAGLGIRGRLEARPLFFAISLAQGGCQGDEALGFLLAGRWCAAAGRDDGDCQGHHQEAQDERAYDVLGGFKHLHRRGLRTISSIRHLGCRVARCTKHRDLNFQITCKVRIDDYIK